LLKYCVRAEHEAGNGKIEKLSHKAPQIIALLMPISDCHRELYQLFWFYHPTGSCHLRSRAIAAALRLNTIAIPVNFGDLFTIYPQKKV
jgi:hypothetical protein